MMNQLSLAAILCGLILSVGASPAIAQSQATQPLKTVEQVYQHPCVACHATGVAHAAMLGDKEAWKPLIAEGQDVLSAPAWVGVRAIPARRNQPYVRSEQICS